MSAVLKPASLTIKPLHPLFVAEVTGVDLKTVSRDEFRAIWDAFNQYEVLVVRDQEFTDETQIAFSKRWGPLETMEAHPANNFRPGHIAVMTNLDDDGNMLPLDHPGMLHRLRNEAWHTDSSFKQIAALCSMLHGRIVPPPGVGSNTDFASGRAAYADYPNERKAEFETMTVIHRVAKPEDVNDPAYNAEQKKRLTVRHPLVRVNPVNGRKNFYAGAHAQEIEGMAVEAVAHQRHIEVTNQVPAAVGADGAKGLPSPVVVGSDRFPPEIHQLLGLQAHGGGLKGSSRIMPEPNLACLPSTRPAGSTSVSSL